MSTSAASDDRNVIVEIRGAAGSETPDSRMDDLFEMYLHDAVRRGWNLEVLGSDTFDDGHLKEIMFVLKGEQVWSAMGHERGPHRARRISAAGSRSDAEAPIEVIMLREPDEGEISVDADDLQVDVYRATGPDGQPVNATDHAVRITHKPTGQVVSIRNDTSYVRNRANAMRILRARLFEFEQGP